jgi:hypothetical protein
MMQYKVLSTNMMWMALQFDYGSLIIKVAPSYEVQSQNLVPFWGFDASKSIEKEKFINNGISKYLELWKVNIVRDEMYTKAMGPYIESWEGILKCLLKPLPKQSPILLEGLWPSSNWKVNHV